MATANLASSSSLRPAHRRERLSIVGAAVLGGIGVAAAAGLALLATLILPLAAAVVFGPTLLELV